MTEMGKRAKELFDKLDGTRSQETRVAVLMQREILLQMEEMNRHLKEVSELLQATTVEVKEH